MIRRSSLICAAAMAIAAAIGCEAALARGGDMGDPFGVPNWQSRQQQRDSDEGWNWGNWSRSRDTRPVEEEAPEVYSPPVYRHDELVKLAGENSEETMPRDALAASVHFQLTEGIDPVLRVHPDHRNAIRDFYAARDYAPVWVGEFGLSMRAHRLLGLLSEAETEGLNSAEYLPSSLLDFDAEEAPSGSLFELARLDLELTVVALKYAHHASAGRIVPSRLGRYIDQNPEAEDAAVVIERLSRTVRPDAYLADLHPDNMIYTNLRTQLAELRSTESTIPDITVPAGELLKVAETDARIPLVQRKLHALGLLDELIYAEDGSGSLSHLFSETLVAAVREFQSLRGLSSDGVIGPATTRAFNSDSTARRLELVTINMERARWLPRELGERHVIVNQPAYVARVFDGGEEIHQTRVIVGTRQNQTPMFSDEMEFVVLNPYWNVPRSIATKEMLPQLMANAAYLDAKGFEVFGPNGRVSSSSVDWESYTASTMPFSFRQPPGSSNALGTLKFLFPNQHSVYMHDTPTKHLFAREVRTFSHGCVRVQNADEFANVILGVEGWAPDRIAAAVATGRNQSITLENRVGVHLTYFTAWADGNGLAIYDDIYGRDEQLRNALGDNRLALK